MNKKESGVTLIVLVITVIILLIIAGITIGKITSDDSIIKQSNQTKTQAERESIIEKIEADLYGEKVKTGNKPNKQTLINIISSNNYGTVEGNKLKTTKGNYEIELTEIAGWSDSE